MNDNDSFSLDDLSAASFTFATGTTDLDALFDLHREPIDPAGPFQIDGFTTRTGHELVMFISQKWWRAEMIIKGDVTAEQVNAMNEQLGREGGTLIIDVKPNPDTEQDNS